MVLVQGSRTFDPLYSDPKDSGLNGGKPYGNKTHGQMAMHMMVTGKPTDSRAQPDLSTSHQVTHFLQLVLILAHSLLNLSVG